MKTKSVTKTIRAYCQSCVNTKLKKEIVNCTGHLVFSSGKSCHFHAYRLTGKAPIKVMRKFCLDCMGGSRLAVNECSTFDCLIHPFRFGIHLRTGKQQNISEKDAQSRGSSLYFEQSANSL